MRDAKVWIVDVDEVRDEMGEWENVSRQSFLVSVV